MKIVFPVYVVLAAMIAPAALAGTATNPEISDGTDAGVPGALDVEAVWFDSLDPRWADRVDRQLQVSIKLADMGALAPALDGADTETRYYYDVLLTHGDTGVTYTVTCYVHVVYALIVNPQGQHNYGISADCNDVRDAFEVRLGVDLLGEILEITISRPYFGGVSLAPGTSVTASVQTGTGDVTTTAGALTGRSPRGPIVDTTDSGSFTL